MYQQSFGPEYNTTADDRRNRMTRRNLGELIDLNAPICQNNEQIPPNNDGVSLGRQNPDCRLPIVNDDEPSPIRQNSNSCLMDLNNHELTEILSSSSNTTQNHSHVNSSSYVEIQPSNDHVRERELVTRQRRTSFPAAIAVNALYTDSRAASDAHRPQPQPPHTYTHHDTHVHAHAYPVNQSLTKTDQIVVIELINKLNTVDGTDELELISFLKNIKPIFDISPNCHTEIIKLIIPKVKGQMFQLFLEAVSSNVRWNVLHDEILHRFIPSIRRREIASFELDRPQQPNETFSEYVDHIISIAFALKSSMSESEVIEIALTKCNPTVRSHFSFGQMPQSLFELKSFANRITSSMRAEERYFGNANRRPLINSSSRVVNQTRQNPTTSSNDLRNRPRERIVKCYRCQGEGHIARNCRVSLN